MLKFSCPLVCGALLGGALQAAPPIILTQPQDTTVNFASAADFSVSAANAVAYQWRFNGTPIDNATNATLELDDVTNAGVVDVVVSAADAESTNSLGAALFLTNGTLINLVISGYPGGYTSNLTIQLFDHDKPATAENFIHYIAAGAYSNMFFDRLIPGFVLQGGSYYVTNEFSDSLSVESILDNFSNPESAQFPQSVDNEFKVGPLIHNYAGTIAMAKASGDPDSAENAFFLNLADNSTNLDAQNGGFTVFGRVVSGSMALSYFNGLAKDGGGIYDDSITDTNSTFTDVPVNDDGLSLPANSNLFYAAFSFPDGYPLDTTPPTVTLDSIVAGATNVVATGTASDNVGVAQVYMTVFKSDFSYIYSYQAQGTAHWTADLGALTPGNYQLQLDAQDGAGNRASDPPGNGYAAIITNFVVPAITVTQGPPPVILTQPQDVLVNLASAADFSVIASNVVSYQWRLNGIPIANATNATLAMDDVTNAGVVDVVLDAADGTSTNSSGAALVLTNGTVVNLVISGYPGGYSSNLTIQLFDHDKPATVENFLHYIAAGAYSNMFFDRLIPGFVLQGGSYYVTNEFTDFLSVESILDNFSNPESAQFPQSVDNEFNVGPLIHNYAGTIAMAKASGEPDSAENAFFFNLANNSTNLDSQNGGFTVFGRVVSGGAALGYFNGLTKDGGGIYDDSITDTNSTFTDVPVNDEGLSLPANSNLFYAAFSLPFGYPLDTNAPTVALTSISVSSTDVSASGTASDNVGIAQVFMTLFKSDFSLIESFQAQGTAHWTSDFETLSPGSYELQVDAQDGAGNRASDPPGNGYSAITTNFVVPAVVPVTPALQSVVLAGQNLTVTWSASPAATYQLQYKTDLSQPSWQDFGAPMTPANGVVSLTDIVTNQQSFYRVVLTN